MGRFVAVLMLLSAWGCASAGLVEVRGARIAEEGDKIRLLIDLRTVEEADDEVVLAALARALTQAASR